MPTAQRKRRTPKANQSGGAWYNFLIPKTPEEKAKEAAATPTSEPEPEKKGWLSGLFGKSEPAPASTPAADASAINGGFFGWFRKQPQAPVPGVQPVSAAAASGATGAPATDGQSGGKKKTKAKANAKAKPKKQNHKK